MNTSPNIQALMKKLRKNEIEWTGRWDENFVENSRQFRQDHVNT